MYREVYRARVVPLGHLLATLVYPGYPGVSGLPWCTLLYPAIPGTPCRTLLYPAVPGMPAVRAVHQEEALGSEASRSLGKSFWPDYPAQSCPASSRDATREGCHPREDNGQRLDSRRVRQGLFALGAE